MNLVMPLMDVVLWIVENFIVHLKMDKIVVLIWSILFIQDSKGNFLARDGK